MTPMSEEMLEPDRGNVYRPHKLMITSGKIWRCRHGLTGYDGDLYFVGCPDCQKDMTAQTMTREEFEDRLLADKAFFADWAWKYMGSAEGYRGDLLGWSWQKYQDETTPPAHTHAWTTEARGKGVEG